MSKRYRKSEDGHPNLNLFHTNIGSIKKCLKCHNSFSKKKRVDCVNDKDKEVSYCLKCYDNELSVFNKDSGLFRARN